MIYPRLKILIKSYELLTFHLFGTLGFLLGTTLGISLTLHQQLPLWALGLMSLLGAIQLFAHTWVQKILTGTENLVYYRHEIGILLICALVLRWVGLPVLPFLDISLLGVGVFLLFGRVGCYHVGCCHGQPCSVGVRYSQEHADAGFPWYLVGVRVFPIQLVESFFVLLTVLVGTGLVLRGYPPGAVLVWYTVFYGGVRFVLEFYRGDPERPYWKGFSEAQWTTLGLYLFTATLAFGGRLPFYQWHIVAVAGLAILMLGVATYRRRQPLPANKTGSPKHIQEIALALKRIEHIGGHTQYPPTKELQDISIGHTSLGLNISSGTVQDESSPSTHYTLSISGNGQTKPLPMNLQSAEDIGRLIQKLRHERTGFRVQNGRTEGVFHVIFTEA